MNPDILSLDLRLLAAFDALLEERNVTRAAERLSLTQQAMSGILARLRELFDDPLFVRARYGITPTPKAESMQEPVRDLIRRSELLLLNRSFDPATAEATLRISAIANVQRTLLIPFLVRLRERAPRVRVAFVPYQVEELVARMEQRAIDIAVTVRPLAPPDLPSSQLVRSRWVCAMRHDHPFTGKRLSLKSFLAYHHIVVSPTDLTFRGSADDVLGKLGHRRQVAVSVPDFCVCCETLASTDLLAVVPIDVARLYEDELRCYPVPFEMDMPELIAVWPKRLEADPLHRWAREQLAIVAKEVPAR